MFLDRYGNQYRGNCTIITAAVLGVLFIIILLLFRWKKRTRPCCEKIQLPVFPQELLNVDTKKSTLIHKLSFDKDQLRNYKLEEKDSLEEHLNLLTQKLAEKESKLALSKTKVREVKNEASNVHAIDSTVRSKYQDIMSALRAELLGNEMQCRKLQQQIQAVSKKRAEIKQEMVRGSKLFSEAAVELATNLAEIQKGKISSSNSQPKKRQCVCGEPANKCSHSAKLKM